MVFRRRDRLTLGERLRQLFPRRGWRRGIEYVGHRVRRIPDTPHRIALGFACGVMMSFTPFFGLHLVGSMGLAWLVRGNVIASMIGQFVGNPFTLPFIAWISMSLGRTMLGGGFLGRSFERIDMALALAARGVWRTFLSLFGIGESEWNNVRVIWSDVVLPYFVGGLLPGLIASALFYWLVRALVAAYQARRRARRLERAHQRLAEAGAGVEWTGAARGGDAKS